MKQRLEKYSERFDNKDNELAEGIFNPETWGKRMVEEPKQETLEQAAENHINNDLDLYESLVDGHISYNIGIDLLNNLFINGAKWQQEQIIDFLHSEITERRDYTASKMCEKVIEFIEQFKNK